MTGVSPAYFLSRSGPGFGPADIVSGLPFLAASGYESYQAEVFLETALSLWTEASIRAVAESTQTNGLVCSAFVAHFLGTVFSSESTLRRGLPLDQAKAALAIASSMLDKPANKPANKSGNKRVDNPGNKQPDSTAAKRPDNSPVRGAGDRVFVVPVPAFAWPETSGAAQTAGSPDIDHRSMFRDILRTLMVLCGDKGLHLALELLPGNVLGGSAEFLSLSAEPGFSDLGLLFDTGHFWAMGEKVQDLPGILGSRILATHLCDNDGITNLSLCPGDGTIAFPDTLKALGEAGYSGSLDLEIVCFKAMVDSEYRKAFAQFQTIAKQAVTPSDSKRAAGKNTNLQAHKETI